LIAMILERHERVRALGARDLLRPARARADDADAQPALAARGEVHRGLHLLLLAHVAGGEPRAELVGERLPLLRVDVRDGDRRAELVQPPGGRLPEARRPADDQCRASLDAHGRGP
jgi:hypothetical protein